MPRLRQPFGRLIPGEPKKTLSVLRKIIKNQHPMRVTTVGDVVSRETLQAKIHVNLRIVDNISMRRPSQKFDIKAKKTYHVKNPAGTITEESWETIKQAMKDNDAAILVDGEEDLLTLPCIVESPEDALVLYGQPNEGLVVVETNQGNKNEARLILDRMIIEEIPGP